jgi:hypothetical protein
MVFVYLSLTCVWTWKKQDICEMKIWEKNLQLPWIYLFIIKHYIAIDINMAFTFVFNTCIKGRPCDLS